MHGYGVTIESMGMELQYREHGMHGYRVTIESMACMGMEFVRVCCYSM